MVSQSEKVKSEEDEKGPGGQSGRGQKGQEERGWAPAGAQGVCFVCFALETTF